MNIYSRCLPSSRQCLLNVKKTVPSGCATSHLWQHKWCSPGDLALGVPSGQKAWVCVAFAFAAPSMFYLRYDSEKRQEAQPWATPAQSIPRGDRPEARGLLARRTVRRVLLGTAAKIFSKNDVLDALAPAVLRDATTHRAGSSA